MMYNIFADFNQILEDPVFANWKRKRVWDCLRWRWGNSQNRASKPSGNAIFDALDSYKRGLNEQDGLAILLGEATRTLGRSGIWGEDSTMRHLHVTASYSDAWLLAKRYDRPERTSLENIVRAMIGALTMLRLPGGVPDIGDNPDGKNFAWFACLVPSGPERGGWIDRLAEADQSSFLQLREECIFPDWQKAEQDGWLRFDKDGWSSLFHVRPDGWLPQNGCCHHDLVATEIHYGNVPIFIDSGGLLIDGYSAMPTMRPGYDKNFCQSVIKNPPVLRSEFDGASLYSEGFLRIGGVRIWKRRWKFMKSGLQISDQIIGTGRRQIECNLITPLPSCVEDGAVIINLGARKLRLTADIPLVVKEQESRSLNLISLHCTINLPWIGTVTMEWLDI